MDEMNTTEELVTPVKTEASLKPVKVAKVTERTIEQLESVAVKNMTEKELKKYVDYLRDYKAATTTQMQTLKDAFAGVKKQHTALEAEFNAFKMAAKTQIQFCKDTLTQAFKSVHYMAPLED